MDTNLSIEEALRVIHEKAAVLRHLGDVAAAHSNYISPDPAVLRGIGTTCADIEALIEGRQKRTGRIDARPPERSRQV